MAQPATVILSRYTVALDSVALRFPGFERAVVAGESRYTPSKGPVAPIVSALTGRFVLQVASWEVSRSNAKQAQLMIPSVPPALLEKDVGQRLLLRRRLLKWQCTLGITRFVVKR